MKKLIHVAVGVIHNSLQSQNAHLERKILIAKRADHQHQGGLWEFPGGKVEQGESVQQALKRELEEELGLQTDVENMQPLITIPFHYPDKSVLLDVWNVYGNEFDQDLSLGKEGQPLVWAQLDKLGEYDFPAANKAILDALVLPQQIIISPDTSNCDEILKSLAQSIKDYPGSWVQLRAPSLDQQQYTQLAMRLYGICKEAGNKLIWNCPLAWYQVAFADGLHLSQANFDKLSKTQRPIPDGQWLSMACHNLSELEIAQELADYVLVSPVQATVTHVEATPLTWSGFKVIAQQARIPCYALGGMQIQDIEIAKEKGAQGIAGIGCFQKQPPFEQTNKVENEQEKKVIVGAAE
jgi:8-oxo-dGTP diphosphatase